MKFKLPRQILTPELRKIISRELRKQKTPLVRARKQELKEMAAVARAIAKNGLPKNLICKKLPGGLGYGIFLHPQAKPILKGEIIAPYAGEVSFVPQNVFDESLYAFEPLCEILLTKEEQAHFDRKGRFHAGRYYSMHVDALKKGNFTRFINHSEKPNLVADHYKIPSNPFGLTPAPIEVVYLANKTIRPGEQLLISYEGEDKSYWGAIKIKPIPITPKTFQLDASLKVIGSV